VPPAGSARWQRPSLHRVLRGEFPGFDGTTALCDSLGPSRRTRLPSPDNTMRGACLSLPAVQVAQPRAWGSSPGPHCRENTQGGSSGPPRFPRNPRVPTPCSPTPAGPTRQALRRRQRGPRDVHDEGSHDNHSFGAPSHGLGTRCLRFVSCIAARDARLASRCWPTLRDGIGYPQDSTERFQTMVILLPRALPGARTA